MKNWLPLVLGPELAMESSMDLVCLRVKFSSANFLPYMDFPPLPLKVGGVTALGHEAGDDSVEDTVFEPEKLSLLTLADFCKVGCSLGNCVSKETKNLLSISTSKKSS